MDNQLIRKALYDVNYITPFRFPPTSIKRELNDRDYYQLAMNLINQETFGRRVNYQRVSWILDKASKKTQCPKAKSFYHWLKDNIDSLYETRLTFWRETYE